MKLATTEKSGALVVSIGDDRLDAHNAADFKSAMAGFIAEGNRRLVLDMANVKFIDSSGLGAIVSALKLLAGEGALVISGLQDGTLSMFRLTRMDRVFNLFDNVDEAVADVIA